MVSVCVREMVSQNLSDVFVMLQNAEPVRCIRHAPKCIIQDFCWPEKQ